MELLTCFDGRIIGKKWIFQPYPQTNSQHLTRVAGQGQLSLGGQLSGRIMGWNLQPFLLSTWCCRRLDLNLIPTNSSDQMQNDRGGAGPVSPINCTILHVSCFEGSHWTVGPPCQRAGCPLVSLTELQEPIGSDLVVKPLRWAKRWGNS